MKRVDVLWQTSLFRLPEAELSLLLAPPCEQHFVPPDFRPRDGVAGPASDALYSEAREQLDWGGGSHFHLLASSALRVFEPADETELVVIVRPAGENPVVLCREEHESLSRVHLMDQPGLPLAHCPPVEPSVV